MQWTYESIKARWEQLFITKIEYFDTVDGQNWLQRIADMAYTLTCQSPDGVRYFRIQSPDYASLVQTCSLIEVTYHFMFIS